MNHGFTYTETLHAGNAGRTVLEHLASRFTHSSREAWMDRIQKGLVRLDGQTASAEDLLRPGQRLAWERPPWEEPEVPLAYAVLYEDADLLAVAKPSGLPTMPAGGFLEHTLLHRVRHHYPEATPIHRLGRGTSGLVLFARTPQAGQQLCAAMRERRMAKLYRALVMGRPDQEEFTVAVPIGPIAHPLLGTLHGANPSGKPALSHVRVLERRASTSLVEVDIETGRPHQIRIHMAFSGHPLWGDPLYAAGGGLCGDGTAVPGDEGYLLHALRLTLLHPRSGNLLTLECQPPPQLR